MIRQLEAEGMIPRVSLFEEAISAEVLDERYLSEKPPYFRRLLYNHIPVSLAQLMEALFVLKHYDAVFTHTEKVAFPLALILKWFNPSKPHIAILSRITSVNSKRSKVKIWFFKKIGKSVTRFLVWSSVQRKIAIERFGLSPDKIILLKHGIDQKFWSPMDVKSDMICSVGMEARDYPTLVDALRYLKIPCHIAAGASRGDIFKTIIRLHEIPDIPAWVTVGPKYGTDLKALYARSRFNVIALLPTDSDNGLTTILEAMSMGKPVICTRTEGQVDIIQDGVTGIYVPQGDSGAMRNAIQTLWNDPELCESMGKAARAYILKHHNMDEFVETVKNEVNRAIGMEVPRYHVSIPYMKSANSTFQIESDNLNSRIE